MMLGLALLAMVAPGPGVAAPLTDDELTVTAERMRSVALSIGRSPSDKNYCRIAKSSGDPRIDKMICKDSMACLKPKAVTAESLDACLVERRPALIERAAAMTRKNRDDNA
jgi:hypothetical protein